MLGAFSHGLPSLIIDFGSGAPELRRCCARAGCALGIDNFKVTAEALRPLLERVASDELLATGARRVQRAFAEVQSFPAVAEVLEELAGIRSAATADAGVTLA
jgi:UDP:flavonoid glycosyltransferase YjiC (YdhE family)